MSSGKAWVLVEVPPHGCCLPWPRTAGGVAEWRGAHGAVRVPAWKSPRIAREHLRVSRGSARIKACRFCGCLRGLRVICGSGRHDFYISLRKMAKGKAF